MILIFFFALWVLSEFCIICPMLQNHATQNLMLIGTLFAAECVPLPCPALA